MPNPIGIKESNEDFLVEMEERSCPICGNFHKVEKRKRTGGALIKNEQIRYQEIYYFCPDSDEDENEFQSGEMMDINLVNARKEYCKKHGLKTLS